MNERFENLAEEAMVHVPGAQGLHTRAFSLEKFAELVVRECMRVAMDEIVSDEDIDNTKAIEDRCYLQGNNGGVVDAVVAIKQHFGVE